MPMKRRRAALAGAMIPMKRLQTVARQRALARAAAQPVPRRFPARVGELKTIDLAATATSVDTTGAFVLLNGCIQGTDITERVGRKINVKSVFIRGRVEPAQAQIPAAAGGAETLGQLWRMIVFVDMQPNGAAPAVTDLLNTAAAHSQLNLNNRDRFRILKDKQFACPNSFKAFTAAGSAAGNLGGSFGYKVFRKLDLETIYNAGNAGTIADMTSGALYVFWIGTVAAGVVDGLATYTARVRFSDA